MTTQLVLDAVDQAIWTRHRQGRDLAGLCPPRSRQSYCPSPTRNGSQAAGIKPSTGAVGSSYDNALAESVIGLYKTELIKARRSLARLRRRRDRNRRMGRLVQPPPLLRILRRPDTGGGRGRSLRSPPGPSDRWSLKLESLRTLRGGSRSQGTPAEPSCTTRRHRAPEGSPLVTPTHPIPVREPDGLIPPMTDADPTESQTGTRRGTSSINGVPSRFRQRSAGELVSGP